MEITRLSTKGQIIVPKAVRDAHRWEPGTEFAVEAVAGGILLRPLRPFRGSRLEEVAGALPYFGRAKTGAEMKQAIAEGVRQRRGRGRY